MAEPTTVKSGQPAAAKKKTAAVEPRRKDAEKTAQTEKPPETERAAEQEKSVEIAKPDDEPAASQSGKRAWGTVYYIQAAAAHGGNGGVSLRGPSGEVLGATLSVKDFCRAAREGTVAVSGGPRSGTFNHAGWSDAAQTDCSKVFPRIDPDEIARFERTVFAPVPSDAPDGLGSDSRYRLVPYRTVAVDKSVFPLGTVLFISKLKGKKTPIGVHDGYVFAGDTGVGVKGSHLDFFLGRSRANPAPDVFTGGSATRFDVQVVTDPAVIQRLHSQHLRARST